MPLNAQNRCSSLHRSHRSGQNRSSSLLRSHRSAQNRCSSLLEGHKSASKPLLKPASRLQWRSKSLVQYHCPKSLFADAGLCNTFLCSPLLLLYLPPCMDMHGVTHITLVCGAIFGRHGVPRYMWHTCTKDITNFRCATRDAQQNLTQKDLWQDACAKANRGNFTKIQEWCLDLEVAAPPGKRGWGFEHNYEWHSK